MGRLLYHIAILSLIAQIDTHKLCRLLVPECELTSDESHPVIIMSDVATE